MMNCGAEERGDLSSFAFGSFKDNLGYINIVYYIVWEIVLDILNGNIFDQ